MAMSRGVSLAVLVAGCVSVGGAPLVLRRREQRFTATLDHTPLLDLLRARGGHGGWAPPQGGPLPHQAGRLQPPPPGGAQPRPAPPREAPSHHTPTPRPPPPRTEPPPKPSAPPSARSASPTSATAAASAGVVGAGPGEVQPGPGVNFEHLERASGARVTWHAWPRTKESASDLVAPLGLLYSPMRKIERLATLAREPTRCSHCGAVLNPWSTVHHHEGRSQCAICGSWSPLSESLLAASEIPAELRRDHATVEYELPSAAEESRAAVFLVVDTSLSKAEAEELQTTLQQMVSLYIYIYIYMLVNTHTHTHTHKAVHLRGSLSLSLTHTHTTIYIIYIYIYTRLIPTHVGIPWVFPPHKSRCPISPSYIHERGYIQ